MTGSVHLCIIKHMDMTHVDTILSFFIFIFKFFILNKWKWFQFE